jgi:hypothetical protein
MRGSAADNARARGDSGGGRPATSREWREPFNKVVLRWVAHAQRARMDDEVHGFGVDRGVDDALPLTDGSQRFGGVLENQLVKEGNSWKFSVAKT